MSMWNFLANPVGWIVLIYFIIVGAFMLDWLLSQGE